MALHPELRGKPLCVGGNRGDRGIVACPNYEARAYGVRTAMPLRTAERLLPPDAVFMPGHHKLYSEYSEHVMNILYDFTPDIEQVSVDEAYMDVTGCLHFWECSDPQRVVYDHRLVEGSSTIGISASVRMATAMKDRIWNECGLHTSIGIASNKVCAKIAAGLKKPDGLVLVPHGAEKEFLAPLPVEMVPGIGVKTAPKLHAKGIRTVADILTRSSACSTCGVEQARTRPVRPEKSWVARYLTALANGRDEQVMHYDRVEKSISRDTTFWRDTDDIPFIESTLYYLSERCCKTLRERDQVAATVTAKVRFADFTTVQKQYTSSLPTANEEDIFGTARTLLHILLPPHRMIRLVGVKVSHITDSRDMQLQLDVAQSEKRNRLHARMDALQQKHGYNAIQWGRTHALHQAYTIDQEGYHLHSPVYEL
jgi:DNA polymerase-4